MAGDLIVIDPNILALLGNSFGGNGLPLPFVQEIFLMECHIAGTMYRDNLFELEADLQKGAALVFKREPTNPHDALAIMILDIKGRMLGYIPKAKNEVIARLMDAGKLIFGKLEDKELVGDWLKIQVRVYMRDM